jgi:predicted RNA-binding protein YlxR (DUF448 family)
MREAAAATPEDDAMDAELAETGLRRCLATGETHPRAAMLRFVVAPDPSLGVVPDLAGALPGRGLWVQATRAALARAVARNVFARAARAPVAVDPSLAARVEAALVRRMIEWIGFARRAGAAVAGFEKTRAAHARGAVRLILSARDASPAENARLAGPEIARLVVLERAELGAAFDREAIVHVGILDATWAARLADEAARLAGLRGPDDTPPPSLAH